MTLVGTCTTITFVAVATAVFLAAKVVSGNQNPVMERGGDISDTQTRWFTNHNRLGQLTNQNRLGVLGGGGLKERW